MGMNPRLLRPKAAGNDSDVRKYIAAVEIADAQQLEQAVKNAIRDFILGCKTDGTWLAIKASCILMGARTLSGALVPLVGLAPTNNNFVSGDYNRKTGLLGNGSTKELNTNRNNNADPQNNQHLCCNIGALAGASAVLIGTDGNGNGSQILRSAGTHASRSRNTSAGIVISGGNVIGFRGISRSSSTGYSDRLAGTTRTATITSQSPLNANIFVFSRGAASFSTDRISFYSVGEALDLSLLESRVNALVAAIGAAIP